MRRGHPKGKGRGQGQKRVSIFRSLFEGRAKANVGVNDVNLKNVRKSRSLQQSTAKGTDKKGQPKGTVNPGVDKGKCKSSASATTLSASVDHEMTVPTASAVPVSLD